MIGLQPQRRHEDDLTMHHCPELVIVEPSELAEHKTLHHGLSAKEGLSTLSPLESHVVGHYFKRRWNQSHHATHARLSSEVYQHCQAISHIFLGLSL